MITVTVPYIQTEEDNEWALARIAELWSAEEGSPEFAEMEVLTQLVVNFEAKAYPIDPPTPQAVVRGLMDRMSLSQTDLIPVFGSSSRVSEFLGGKRALSKDQAVQLHVQYGLPLELLLSVYDLLRHDDNAQAAKAPVETTRQVVYIHRASGKSTVTSQAASPQAWIPSRGIKPIKNIAFQQVEGSLSDMKPSIKKQKR